MTAREARDSIEPGSVPYGDRATLESGLSEVLGGGAPPEGGAPPAASGPDTAGITGAGPLAAMLGGELGPPPGGPTDGLSVGAGPGRTDPNSVLGDKAAKLRAIAESAATPSIRYSAQRMLQRMAHSQRKL